MAKAKPKTAGKSGRAEHSLGERFAAWWNGYDLDAEPIEETEEPEPVEQAAAAPPAPAPEPAAEPVLREPVGRNGKPLWDAERIEVVEKMWGEGFTTPGSEEDLLKFLRPLALNEKMSVIDLSAGLGGAVRLMATKFNCWVTGLELSPLLAEAGMARSKKAGMEKQAPVIAYDPDNLKLGRRFDAAVAKEAFFLIADKEKLFDEIAGNLKERGHIVFTDYVVADHVDPAELDGWRASEPVEPTLWHADETVKMMSSMGLDVRVAEDISERHLSLVSDALAGLRDHIDAVTLADHTSTHVVEEVELWARRVLAIQHQGLRLYRFHAILPAV